jgi:hypothetical protein
MLQMDLAVVVFFTCLIGSASSNFINQRAPKNIINFICYFFIIAGILNCLEGISLIADWNPMPIDRETASSAAKHRRGGLVLFLINIWPYFLLLIGANCLFIYWSILKTFKK